MAKKCFGPEEKMCEGCQIRKECLGLVHFMCDDSYYYVCVNCLEKIVNNWKKEIYQWES